MGCQAIVGCAARAAATSRIGNAPTAEPVRKYPPSAARGRHLGRTASSPPRATRLAAARQDVGQQLDRAVETDVTAQLGAYAPLLQCGDEPGARKGSTNHLVRDADGRRGPPVREIGIGRDVPVPRPGRLVAHPHPARDPAPSQGSSRSEGRSSQPTGSHRSHEMVPPASYTSWRTAPRRARSGFHRRPGRRGGGPRRRRTDRRRPRTRPRRRRRVPAEELPEHGRARVPRALEEHASIYLALYERRHPPANRSRAAERKQKDGTGHSRWSSFLIRGSPPGPANRLPETSATLTSVARGAFEPPPALLAIR